MNRICLLFLFILLPLLSYAKLENIKTYNVIINQAENKHIIGAYKNSDSLYNLAFAINDDPSAWDLTNAMVNATIAKNEKAFFNYASKLLSYGVPSTFFSKRKLFQRWNTSNQWKILLKDANINYERVQAKNKNLNNSIDSLLFISNRNLYRASMHQELDIAKFNDTIISITNSLNHLFNKYGFNSLMEKVSGVGIMEDTLISEPKVFKLIEYCSMHLLPTGDIELTKSDAFDPVLLNAYQNGFIIPSIFWKYYSNPNNYNIIYPVAILNGGNIHIPFIDYKDLVKYEMDRKEMGLFDLDSYILKLKYQINNNIGLRFSFKCKRANPDFLDKFSIVSSLN